MTIDIEHVPLQNFRIPESRRSETGYVVTRKKLSDRDLKSTEKWLFVGCEIPDRPALK
jgi:hypothetical protein